VLVFAVASIIGVAVEFMQLYMPTGRSFEVEDMIADAVGALVGTLIFRLILRHVDH
jgi:VanZ family protein